MVKIADRRRLLVACNALVKTSQPTAAMWEELLDALSGVATAHMGVECKIVIKATLDDETAAAIGTGKPADPGRQT